MGIHFDDTWPVASEIDPGRLAARASSQLRAGCELLAIDGRSVEGLSFRQAVQHIAKRPVQLLWSEPPRQRKQAYTPPRPNSPRAVILAPTRELASQIARETKRLSRSTRLVTMLLEHQDELDATILGECDIIVSTPMRLAALIRSAKQRLEAVEVLVVRAIATRMRPAHACAFPCVRLAWWLLRGRMKELKYLRTP